MIFFDTSSFASLPSTPQPKGVDIINGEYPPGVFFKGLKFLGMKIRGLKSNSKFDQFFLNLNFL